jgi:hypothetical protein
MSSLIESTNRLKSLADLSIMSKIVSTTVLKKSGFESTNYLYLDILLRP